jgi:hypothetical protein
MVDLSSTYKASRLFLEMKTSANIPPRQSVSNCRAISLIPQPCTINPDDGDEGDFSLLHVYRAGLGVHPTSYSMGIRGSFPGGKAAGA